MQSMTVCAFRIMLVAASITGALSNVAVAQEHKEPAAKEMLEHKIDKTLTHFPDLSVGKRLFVKCKTCHMVGENPKKRIGPTLNGVVGRAAATSDGFKYSKKMKLASDQGLFWTEESLDSFLTAPRKAVPGTSMAFRGIKDPEQRKALIAFLASFNADGTRVEHN